MERDFSVVVRASRTSISLCVTFCYDEQAVIASGGQSITSLFVKHYRMIQCVMFCLSGKPSSGILKYL